MTIYATYYQWKIEFHYHGIKTCILVGYIYMTFIFELTEQFSVENEPIKFMKIAHYNISP